jgi:hypothetical protein
MVEKQNEHNESNSEWGADWEAAFQAEEDAMFSFDEGEYEELFKQAPNLPSEKTLEAGKAPSEETPSKKTARPLFQKVFQALNTLLAFPQKIMALFASPHNFIKILAYGIPVLICLFFVSTLFRPSPPSPKTATKQPVVAPDILGPFEILEKAALRSQTPAAEKEPQPSRELLTQLAPGEKIRKKWSFSSFLIPAATEDDNTKLSFIIIELTLVALMDAEEALPEQKKPYLRDIIYQFYANRPLYELRSFSLARGEMSRKLRAWVQKQWPEFPVESIIFDKYQVT